VKFIVQRKKNITDCGSPLLFLHSNISLPKGHFAIVTFTPYSTSSNREVTNNYEACKAVKIAV
jgi:hypothetical protein